jgi:hypothetical protein
MNKGSSTGNLNRHLAKLHPEKIDPSIASQAKFMESFVQSTNEKIVSIIYFILFNLFLKINYLFIFHLQVFSNETFREKLCEWVVADDQPFTVVESPEFRVLIKICNQGARIPSADTVKGDVIKLFKNYQTNVHNILQVSEINYYTSNIYNNNHLMKLIFF